MGEITVNEVINEINKFKKMKAPGWDNITNEHIMYSGQKTKATITALLNKVVENEKIPHNLKRGYIVSLPKPNKDGTIKTNNRGITLMCVIYKLLERVILEREKSWLYKDDVMAEIQGAGRKGISCLHTSFLVQEGVAWAQSKGSNVHVAFLDIKKAFDSVWLPGFLVKLHRAGMRQKPWKLLNDAYTNFECAALVNGIPGTWFNVLRGVHQGAPLSMPLYQVYINDLLTSLRQSEYGLCLGDINITSPAHVDDLAIIAMYNHALNTLLTMAYEYSITWFFEFSIEKCVVLSWTKRGTQEKNISFKLGPGQISVKTQCKHMGVNLTSDKKTEIESYSKRINACKSVVYAARSLGSPAVPVPPTVMNKIYWAVAVPRMLYGLDVCPLNDAGMKNMEQAHRQNAKTIQNMPMNTPNPAPLATIGWLSVLGHVAIMKLVFMWRILCLPHENIYRKVLIHVFNSALFGGYSSILSPSVAMLKMIKYYGLLDKLHESINNESHPISYYKRLIKRVVYEREIIGWRASVLMYRDLHIYECAVTNIKLHIWWKFQKHYPALYNQVSSVVAVMSGTQPRQFICNLGTEMCKLCPNRIAEKAEHILFGCVALGVIRHEPLNTLINTMPQAMKNEFRNMTMENKTLFILSGLKSEYCPEWCAIYRAIVKFVYEIYSKRKKMYLELEP